MDLSVVIVTWNVRKLLAACLAALPAATDGVMTEVIVVDNSSTDGTAEWLAAELPTVQLLVNQENAGFARANNQGLARGQGRYSVLLNPDTEPRPASLTQMVNFMDAHPRAGAASPRLLAPGGRPQPYAYGGDPTPLYLFRRALAHLRGAYLHDWGVARPLQIDWVSGACLVARREAVQQVGGLDEAMFMYFEDNDWCRRLRLAGWQVWYNPGAEVVHIGGASLNQNPQARAAYYRSLAYFYTKHYGLVAGMIMAALTGPRR
ncbi:MAG: glycosyltransferase family 2 protein [Nitrososphaerales archaeon]